MHREFNTVKFQRERRAILSEKLTKMTPKEIVKFFKSSFPTLPRRKRVRATSA